MSFGRPPGFSTFTVTPPDRGSFPLDHDGECKSIMQEYMTCLKKNKQDNGQCRHLSRRYLECRMEKGLMEKDDMRNLGYQGDEEPKVVSPVAVPTTTEDAQSTKRSWWPSSSSQPRSTPGERI